MSTPEAVFTFPAPIGGEPFDLDLAPSILFAALYGILSMLVIYRLVHPKMRTTVITNTASFTLERVAVFALRAKEAHSATHNPSRGLTLYWQMSYGLGYITFIFDLINILRVLLVNTTYGTNSPKGDSCHQGTSNTNLLIDSSPGGTAAYRYPPTEGEVDDRPLVRNQWRGICGLLALFGLAPVVTGTIGGVKYNTATHDAGAADTVQTLRYVTAALGLALLLMVQGLAIWAYLRVRRIRRSGLLQICIITVLLIIVSVYRLIAMHNKTPSLTSLGPGSLNSPASKALFYLFHSAPEFLAGLVLFSVDVRGAYATGPFGDWRSKDPKPKPKPTADAELQPVPQS